MNKQSASKPNIAGRIVHGTLILGLRQAAVQIIGAIGGIVLARLLSPAEFGIYAIISFFFLLLSAVGDLGLGASLIRQTEEPTTEDFRRIFAVRQASDLLLLLCFWVSAPWLAQLYGLDWQAVWAFRLLGLALLLTSFQIVPAVQLERRLCFAKLAAVETTQVLVYTLTAIGLVRNGFGVLSFALAWLTFGFTGALLSSLACPWPLGWRWDLGWVKQHLHFSLPFQGISLANLAKDSINPILVGTLLGTAQVGYINWAQMVAAFIVLGLGVLQRVFLPSFARLQNSRDELARLVEQALGAVNALTAPAAVLILVLIDPIIRIVFGDKWLAALPLFYLIWLVNLFAPTTVVVISLLNALGHSRRALSYTLLVVLGTWLFAIPLIFFFGALGYALATAAVQLSSLVLVRTTQKLIPFRVLSPIAPVWLWAAAIGLLSAAYNYVSPVNSLSALLLCAAGAGAVYLCGLFALYGRQLKGFWQAMES